MLIPLPGPHARIEPGVLEEKIVSHFPLHASKPAVVSLTQSTECGTTYRPAEIQALSDVASALAARDKSDATRTASPLTVAADAVVIDTTGVPVDAVVRRALDLVYRSS